MTPAAKNFIEKLLLKKPAERMSATECLAHEWLSIESQAAAARENRSLSITLIGNLKAWIKQFYKIFYDFVRLNFRNNTSILNQMFF